jgi:hypothetical protein
MIKIVRCSIRSLNHSFVVAYSHAYINSVGVDCTMTKSGSGMKPSVYVRLINADVTRNLQFSYSSSIKNTNDNNKR